ncbi:MAG TPA: UDP-N-acetylmuramate dehydrogenase [Usitatibacter sp.]|nr:UDP-N-acetylmuramate dehydrogenase [Usitatibacter sp.]
MSDAHLLANLRGTLRHDEPMAKHVSWRAGGRAKTFFQPASVADLCLFLRTRPAAEPVLFVGLGSNLLVRDGGFDGSVVFTHHALTGIQIVGSDPTPDPIPDPIPGVPGVARDVGSDPIRSNVGSDPIRPTFRAGAGVPTPHLARFAAKHGAGGGEWMAGVPGTIGGALAMNAGCYGGETWNHVIAVETVDRAGNLRLRRPTDYSIGYRHVALVEGGDEWFVSGVFVFERGDEAASMARMRALLSKRVASQPLGQPNAGSVFRNPPGDHAARLIESCGLKGFAIGGAQVSPKHANFIVNLGGATAADIESLVDHVQAVVHDRTGVDLVREVRIVGTGGDR